MNLDKLERKILYKDFIDSFTQRRKWDAIAVSPKLTVEFFQEYHKKLPWIRVCMRKNFLTYSMFKKYLYKFKSAHLLRLSIHRNYQNLSEAQRKYIEILFHKQHKKKKKAEI